MIGRDEIHSILEKEVAVDVAEPVPVRAADDVVLRCGVAAGDDIAAGRGQCGEDRVDLGLFARQYDEQGAVAGREDAADVATLLVAERFVPHVGNQRLDGLFERRVGVLAVNQYDPAAAVERPGEFRVFPGGIGRHLEEDVAVRMVDRRQR